MSENNSTEDLTHPGVIVFVDEDAGTERTRRVGEVPRTIAFINEQGVEVPVVRVVSHLRGNQRVIKSFAADGRLLSTTVQAPPPPPQR